MKLLSRSAPQGLLTDELQEKLHAWKIKDVVLLQGGSLVWEWHDKGVDRIGAVYSVTKSILSALIGIALEQGLIESIETPISRYFPQIERADDERMQAIRIKHLLTMTSGIEWPEFDKPYWQMKRTDDPVSFVLSQPMEHEPGDAFAYNSGGSHLLSAILTQVTGMSTYDYADQKLFKKLAFRRPRWNSDHAGIFEGGVGLHLTAEDMAKFGQLYLQGGRWEGEQVVPEAWVASSTTAHHKGFSHYEPPIFGEYGYHWWVSSQAHNRVVDFYFAKGYGGQYIAVVPSLELVAAIRKEPDGKGSAIYAKLLLLETIVPFCSSSVH
ncbi:serine hydrolase domain-containing protein [Paenibacillus albus]|uniref:Class C beta-lactamase-related serine hydrolase n=1 Tax=Paenibacillus albus TaxID=2495582 RepID=A0A3Q8X716_9BACL|nr:serine hydrolase [Paenibacillus albus]AZN41913.1 class C beta-lactamase-related serine hydrolase [Paenibacillus albus]